MPNSEPLISSGTSVGLEVRVEPEPGGAYRSFKVGARKPVA